MIYIQIYIMERNIIIIKIIFIYGIYHYFLFSKYIAEFKIEIIILKFKKNIK